jgi:hypothetical protein
VTFVVVLCKFYEVVVPNCGSLDRSYSRRERGPPPNAQHVTLILYLFFIFSKSLYAVYCHHEHSGLNLGQAEGLF